MNQYTIDITNLTVSTASTPEVDRLVTRAQFNAIATSDIDGVTSSTFGIVDILSDNVGPFTPFAQITKEQVTTWILASPQWLQVSMVLDNQLEIIRNPPFVTVAPPWIPIPVIEINTATSANSTSTPIISIV